MYEITELLISMPEVQALCAGLYGVTLLLLLCVIGIFISHSAFVVFGSKLMYRRKKPVEGWNKHFYPAIFALMIIVCGVAWVFWQLSQGVMLFMV